MIKFFRKIRYTLLNQGKTSQYLKYALGEILLVVVGILIALQLNTWNNERTRKKTEDTLLNQLQADLKESETELMEIKQFYLDRARASSKVTSAFWKKDIPSDSIGDDMLLPRSARIYSPIMGTARSLINSGNIDIISAAQLKNDIISYVEKVDYQLKDIDRYQESYYREGINKILLAMPNTFRTMEHIDKGFDEQPRSPYVQKMIDLDMSYVPLKRDKVPFQSNLETIFNDETIYVGYFMLYLSHRNIYTTYDEILLDTQELMNKIEKTQTQQD